MWTHIVNKGGSGCTGLKPCGKCQGDCDTDAECVGDLKCYQRTSSSDVVPGCSTGGYVKTQKDHDYCYGDSGGWWDKGTVTYVSYFYILLILIT